MGKLLLNFVGWLPIAEGATDYNLFAILLSNWSQGLTEGIFNNKMSMLAVKSYSKTLMTNFICRS